MVGLDRDGVETEPSIPDPCSHFETKMKDVIDKKKRWLNDFADDVNELDDAKTKLSQASEAKQHAQGVVESLQSKGADAPAINDAKKALQTATEDEKFATRMVEILSNRLRHFDAAMKDLQEEYEFLEKELDDCRAVIDRKSVV